MELPRRMTMQKWLLPEYIEDLLPGEAARVERLRRCILDLFFVHGYELVVPPMLEYVESLLTGTGHDLDLKTFSSSGPALFDSNLIVNYEIKIHPIDPTEMMRR